MRKNAAEESAKVAYGVVYLTETATHDCSRQHLIGKAEAGGNVGVVHLLVAVTADATDTDDTRSTGDERRESAVTRCVDGFGIDDVPTDTVVHSKFPGHAIAVLTIEGKPFLAIRRIVLVHIETLKLVDMAKEERCQARAGAVGTGGSAAVEVEDASAVVVAGVAEIQGVTNVPTELDGVVADHL